MEWKEKLDINADFGYVTKEPVVRVYLIEAGAGTVDFHSKAELDEFIAQLDGVAADIWPDEEPEQKD